MHASAMLVPLMGCVVAVAAVKSLDDSIPADAVATQGETGSAVGFVRSENCIEGDCNKGFAVTAFPDGNSYEGDWNHGQYNGDGEYTFAEGHKYVGEFANDMLFGRGVFAWANGRQYAGDYKHGKRDGLGVMTTEEGRYEGEWKADKKHGIGVEWFPEGRRYEGEFENDKANGFGVYYAGEGCNAESVRGEWTDDVLDTMGGQCKVSSPAPMDPEATEAAAKAAEAEAMPNQCVSAAAKADAMAEEAVATAALARETAEAALELAAQVEALKLARAQSENELRDFLTGLPGGSLEQYLGLFEENGFEGLVDLIDITSDELKEIGITKLGHRKRIIKGLVEVANRPPAIAAPGNAPATATA